MAGGGGRARRFRLAAVGSAVLAAGPRRTLGGGDGFSPRCGILAVATPCDHGGPRLSILIVAPPPPSASGVGWARCPQLAAPSDGGSFPRCPLPPPPTGCPCVLRWVWGGTRGATRAGDVALPSSRRRPGLCVEGLASGARTSSCARFGCQHVPLVATNLFSFSLVPSILCLLPSPLQTWAYSIVLWFAVVIPRSKSSHFQLALDNWSRCLFWDLCSSSTLAGLCSVPSAEVAVDDLS